MASSDEQRQHQHQPGNGNSREGSFSPLMRSIQQQQPSQQHEDYDWMGVLDTLDDHFDLVHHQYHHHDNGDNAAAGAGAGAEYAAALPTAASVDSANVVVVGAGVQHQNIQNHGHEYWQSTSSTGVGSGGGNNDNSAAALMLAAAAAARECSAGVGSISMSVQEAVAAAADAEVDHRKQSRVERKRTREKKRRFDTNSQFTALAELVKEIEATDLAEEALFDFNKRHDNHGQEGEEEQQHQHQNLVDERVGPNNSNDGRDASVTVSSVASGEKHSKKFKSEDLDNNNSSSSNNNNNNNNNNNCPSSTSLLPMPNGAKSSTLLSSTSSATSNRIDLIARTIVQLNHFRMLRRRRNNELRECQRKNCELRKECEGLHRLVAQYKAMGKMEGGGYNRPQLQEKVMMMVPMMVPQDAVTQIATGYPAAHQYQAAAAPCTTPFMPTTMTMTSSQQQHHHPHYFTNTTTPHPWMGGGVNMSSSASYHPHHTSTTSGGVPGAQLGHQHHQQSFIHNMPSTSMPPSSQPHQYNYPAVGPSNFQPSGELHSMNTSTTASEATDNSAANNDSSQTQPHGMPNDGTGGEMNAFQGNIQSDYDITRHLLIPVH
ncbi:hypothetical protein ACHAWU_006704 [Discostella pseudostelligera]|uniref:BZIP domain-containing protein n=1 Tax=Discostella pseudostelligera TaxID=259834 RepID=A0ABD3N1B3_9STRA